MEGIIIRNIEEKDIPSIVDINISSWKTAYKGIIDADFLNSIDRDENIAKIRKNYQQDSYIVAEIDKEIVGFCKYVDNNDYTPNMPEIDCEIVALYVKPDLKNNGIGTKLFKFAINDFKNKNRTKMIIWCLKDNKPSREFYTKMGGEIVKEKVKNIEEKQYWEVGFEYNI